jgi:hypothetical protein
MPLFFEEGGGGHKNTYPKLLKNGNEAGCIFNGSRSQFSTEKSTPGSIFNVEK